MQQGKKSLGKLEVFLVKQNNQGREGREMSMFPRSLLLGALVSSSNLVRNGHSGQILVMGDLTCHKTSLFFIYRAYSRTGRISNMPKTSSGGQILGFKMSKSREREDKLRQKAADRRKKKKLEDMKTPTFLVGFSWPTLTIKLGKIEIFDQKAPTS